jgi:hypothetical protein
MSRIIPILLVLVAIVPPVGAQVRVVPVMGDIELSAGEVSCPSLPSGCTLCINDEDTTGDNRLIIALGETYPFITTEGYAAGVVRPFVVVDGVRLTPDLLPCDAYFRSGVSWSDDFTPNACGATPPGVTYQIGTMPEATVTGDGSAYFTIPATEANEVSFEVSLCSQFFYWGGGCNIGGSSDESWELYVPAAMNALEIPAGDAVPLATPGSDFAVDFSSSPGGVLCVSHVSADPPVAPPIMHLNGYWDVHSDLAPGAFTADVSFGFDANALPPEVEPGAITVAVYDTDSGVWDLLATTVDVDGQTATATTVRLSKFVLIGGMALPAEATSWGAVKARYATEEE